MDIPATGKNSIEEYIKCSTVDKFQGQERDFIIAGYGERDLKGLLQIKEFVYNRNRLNVVISRAKKKCIIVLSENLIKRYKECYDSSDEKLIDGVEFMCGLKDYLVREESDLPDEFGGVFLRKRHGNSLMNIRREITRKSSQRINANILK